jgi:large subunit ribosomal protein L22
MSVKATANGVRISPRKVQVVAALVRGRTVDDALTILTHTPRRSAVAVRKVIESAKANATHNHGYKSDGLKITEISVTHGPTLKRYRPAARGRALKFQRRSSHIRVVIEGDLRPAAKPKAPAKAAAAKKEETK